jgi:hypothetical protein
VEDGGVISRASVVGIDSVRVIWSQIVPIFGAGGMKVKRSAYNGSVMARTLYAGLFAAYAAF